eukprot:sb/3475660/
MGERTPYLGHVTGYKPIRDQYLRTCSNIVNIYLLHLRLLRLLFLHLFLFFFFTRTTPTGKLQPLPKKRTISVVPREQEAVYMLRLEARVGTDRPIRTRYLGHVTGYQPIRGQYFLNWSVSMLIR